MRAIVQTICHRSEPTGGQRAFDPLTHLVDRPLIQHLVESLAGRGIKQFEFLLGDDACSIETTLGDGSRWGVAIRYHLIHDESHPYTPIRTVVGPDAEGVFYLVHADHLVEIGDESPSETTTVFLKDERDPASIENWTGWALAAAPDLLRIADAKDREELLSIWGEGVRQRPCRDDLAIRDDREIVHAQDAVLSGRFSGLARTGREVQPGVWLSRNVSLHQSALIEAPVHIAEDCWIGPHVRLGPNVAVGAGSVLDEGTHFADALVMPRTYIGRSLDLFGVIVDRDRVHQIASGTVLEPDDPTMFSEVTTPSFRADIRNVVDRLLSIPLLFTLMPFVACWCLWTRIRGQGLRFASRAVVRIPARRDERRWTAFRLWELAGSTRNEEPSRSDLCTRIWPGLIAVAAGNMRLVGQPARTVETLRDRLRERLDWPLSARPGLITEAQVRLDPDATPQEQHMADEYHALHAGFRHDLRLVWGYVRRMCGKH